ncbi:uncharacterized protein LOC142022128 [Carettochelys insculpta]|uniref:uncharacterized protein LOC142022128 n=1 Tax=Carettochelys insculpta TaxID=44489 RepID=UPI003EBEAF7B
MEPAPEASPAPWGPTQEPTPGALEEEEEEEGESSSRNAGLRIAIPSRSSSRVSAHRLSLTVGVDHQLHHRKDRRAPTRCQWSRTAHRVHHSRPAPRQRTNQPHGGEDSGPSTTTRQRRAPSCWPSIIGSWRLLSSSCRWRSTASSCRSGRWPGARRHGGPSCGPSTVSPTTWPPMPRRLPLRPPCLLHPLLHPLRRPPLHRHLPPRALPLRGTWGQLTPAGHIYRSTRPPASPG